MYSRDVLIVLFGTHHIGQVGVGDYIEDFSRNGKKEIEEVIRILNWWLDLDQENKCLDEITSYAYELPYKSSVLPLSISSKFSDDELQEVLSVGVLNDQFFEISCLEFIQFISKSKLMSNIWKVKTLNDGSDGTKEEIFTYSTGFCHYPVAHKIVNKVLEHCNKSQDSFLNDTLYIIRDMKIFPTSLGLKKSSECFLKQKILLPGQPVLSSLIKHSRNSKILDILGIKIHQDVNTILEKGPSILKWNSFAIFTYFLETKDELSSKEVNELSNSKFLRSLEPQNYNSLNLTLKRRDTFSCPNRLYFPNTDIIEMGYPILDTVEWNVDAVCNLEAKEFLRVLGMKFGIPCIELLQLSEGIPLLIESKSEKYFDVVPIENGRSKRNKILRYLISEIKRKPESEFNYIECIYNKEIKFLPAVCSQPFLKQESNSSKKILEFKYNYTLSSPHSCYCNPECMLLGFSLIDTKWRKESVVLCVNTNPSEDDIIEKLRNFNYLNADHALKVFSYLNSVRDIFMCGSMEILKKINFVPLFNDEGESIYVQISPEKIFHDQKTENTLYTQYKTDYPFLSYLFR
ncbi:hypothetical protein AYI70_g2736 [Smittium culicis]|uniref:Uncharacterized protein n=1 Tax=Smittium culicis TaxID=133412 RepID=A0A1R1Y6X7_9FUNG|nr:hypothetical protein AYI70_g2736 [Smittium culicis]